MARGINKVILVGNLGQDPELRYTGNGTAVCNLRVATSESYKDQDGNLVEKTEWHSVVAWSRLAEICGEYLKKGSQVYFEGSLQTRSYEDKEGVTKWVTEIRAREMLMLGGRGQGGEHDSGEQEESYRPRQQQPARQDQRRAAPPAQQRRQQPQTEPSDDYTFGPEDDLPF